MDTGTGYIQQSVPNIHWLSGRPDDGYTPGQVAPSTWFDGTANAQNYLAFVSQYKAFDDLGYNQTPYYLSQATAAWGSNRNLQETFNNYKYDWTSVTWNVVDKRNNFNYSVTSTPTPIVEQQIVYSQRDVTTTTVVPTLSAKSTIQNVYETKTVTTGVVTTYSNDFKLSDAVGFDSIKGKTVRINTTSANASQISGSIKSTALTTDSVSASNLDIRSTGSLTLGSNAPAMVVPLQSNLLANSLNIQGAGLTVTKNVMIAGSNGKQVQSVSLNAGNGTLTLLSSPAPADRLVLKGENLILPASTTTKLYANDIDIASGLTFKANQSLLNGKLELAINSDGSGAASGLRLNGDDASSIQTFDLPLPGWTTAAAGSSAPLYLYNPTGSATNVALGSFANGAKVSGHDVWTNLNFNHQGGTISFDLKRVDSWDHERFYVFANDVVIFRHCFGLGAQRTDRTKR